MPLTGQSLPIFLGVEFAELRKNLGEAIGETIETTARMVFGKGAAKHLHGVLSGEQ